MCVLFLCGTGFIGKTGYGSKRASLFSNFGAGFRSGKRYTTTYCRNSNWYERFLERGRGERYTNTPSPNCRTGSARSNSF